MKIVPAVWRQGLWLWLPALVFCLLNLAFFSAYRLIYAGQKQFLNERVARREMELGRLEAERRALEEYVERAHFNRREVARFYRERFATESERLTRVIDEVKTLAQRAGLEPAAISYPEESIQDFDLLKKSFVFSVEGSYADLRKFVNFLELSESFLTLEGIGVTETGGSRLRIDLRLSTLFVSESGPEESSRGGRRRSS